MTVATLVRDARRRAGLTQAALGAQAGWRQPAVARLERAGADPRVSTLERALRAAGHRLELRAVPLATGVDEDQIRRHLELTPGERLERFERDYAGLRDLAGSVELIDGDAA